MTKLTIVDSHTFLQQDLGPKKERIVKAEKLSNGVVLYITLEGDKIVWVSENANTCPYK